jgi:hypothetical protein
MKALILYVVFVIVGGLLSVAIGDFVEIEVSSNASLIVFLLYFCKLRRLLDCRHPFDGSVSQRCTRQTGAARYRAGRTALARGAPLAMTIPERRALLAPLRRVIAAAPRTDARLQF